MNSNLSSRHGRHASRWIAGAALLLVSMSSAYAQTYDFADLARERTRESTEFTLRGFGAKAAALGNRIGGEETERTVARDAARAAAATDSTSRAEPSGAAPTDRSAKKAPPAQKRFVCTMYCNSSAGPTIQRSFVAASRAEAARQAGDDANRLCQSAGFTKSSGLSFAERQCREE